MGKLEAMKPPALFSNHRPAIIAALHLPPSPAIGRSSSSAIGGTIDYALRNAEKAVRAGIPALYIQDLGDLPAAKHIQPHTIAFLSVVGSKLREEFPDLVLGICTMSHGAREPLAIAQAISAQFVRIKVYTGAMVKAEGILEGCAHEAITYRAAIGAEQITILADVHDRTGKPLGAVSLAEAARSAAIHNRADALIVTGSSFEESMQMLKEVSAENLGVPILLGGGADDNKIARVLQVAQGAIVSSSFKPIDGWTHASMRAEWDFNRMLKFMQYVGEYGAPASDS